jgi:hypothetical protein
MPSTGCLPRPSLNAAPTASGRGRRPTPVATPAPLDRRRPPPTACAHRGSPPRRPPSADPSGRRPSDPASGFYRPSCPSPRCSTGAWPAVARRQSSAAREVRNRAVRRCTRAAIGRPRHTAPPNRTGALFCAIRPGSRRRSHPGGRIASTCRQLAPGVDMSATPPEGPAFRARVACRGPRRSRDTMGSARTRRATRVVARAHSARRD